MPNGSRSSDVLTSRSADIHQPPPTHDHARDALRLALGSILAPKRSTPNPATIRSGSSSGTASPAHFQFPYHTGSHTPSPANSSSTPAPQGPPSHLSFPHPHAHQHHHHPHGHSHLIPLGREHSHSVSGHSSSSHSPHSSSPATPITESASSPFNHYPRPGLLTRSISSSSAHNLSSNRPSPVIGGAGADSPVPPPSLPAIQDEHEVEHGIHAPAPRLPDNTDASTETAALHPYIPTVAVSSPGESPIVKNKLIQTLEGKTHSAWDALIHGPFS
ncbi:hypothetical protein DFJ43DRAFT_1098538 [Lentinula guzmanii]|uniref:Uncharacterized protein n=1 Tax=Lentinula guzmanii TaxID=2804957 RepID=A0AA38MWZ3_9AGAR|nr:hypothetical protein DFJ43DRAFT_1098538 [Lentinula guzmanii]